MFSAFSYMLPSFAVHNAEQLDEYEILSNVDSVDFDVRSISVDTFSCSSQSGDNETTADVAEWRYGSGWGPDGERLPSYHYDSVIWFEPWDVAHTAEEQAEIDACSLSIRAMNAMAHAGRGDAKHTFKDLRYGHRSRQRERRSVEKYWNHRIVSKGAVNAARGKQPEAMTKRELYNKAQEEPRPQTWNRPRSRKDRLPCGCIILTRKNTKRHRRLDCEEPPRYDIDEFDLWVMRLEIATESAEPAVDVPQLSLLDFVRSEPG